MIPSGVSAAGVSAVRLPQGRGPYVAGEFVADPSRGNQTILEPATGTPLADVGIAGPREAAAAIDAAAGGAWGAMTGAARTRCMLDLHELLRAHAAELASLCALEAGIPIRRALEVDVPLACAHVLHYAGWADKLAHARGLGPRGTGAHGAGVVAGVGSADSPLATMTATLAPVLALGGAAVLVAPASAPLSALRLAELCHAAGLPPGAVAILTGGAAASAALLAGTALPGAPARVAVHARAGSCAAVAALTRAPVLRAPTDGALHVVFDDVPLAAAVDDIVDGLAGSWPGRPAARRIVIQEPVYDEIADALRRRLATLRVGDPLDPNTDLGPFRSAARRAAVAASVAEAAAAGVEAWTAPADLPAGTGAWPSPAVLTGVAPAHRIARADCGGPVAALLSFRTADEAVAIVRELGHAGGPAPAVAIWTVSAARAAAVAARLGAPPLGVRAVAVNAWRRVEPGDPLGGPGIAAPGGTHGLGAFCDG